MTYDDNLFISHDNPESDFQFAITPMVAFGWGDVGTAVHEGAPFPSRFDDPIDYGEERNLLLVSYALTAALFADHTDENSVNHDAFVRLSWHFHKLDVNFNSRFQTLSNADLEIGTRVDRTFLDNALQMTYNFSEKVLMEAKFLNYLRDYDVGVSAIDWETEEFFDYAIRPKTRIGLGVGVGYLHYDSDNNENFQRALARVLYKRDGQVVDRGQSRRRISAIR